MNITDVCIRKPVFAWMIMAATLVFGGVAASRIGISQYPDVDFPTITITTTWEGAAPEVMEHDVVDVLEEAMAQVEGVKSITSTSQLGTSTVTVELDLARSVDAAMQDVQAKVSQSLKQLPKDIDPPVVAKSNPEDQPIMWVGLSGPVSQQAVSDYARYRLKEKLQTLPGVGEIQLGGYIERNVRIWLDAHKLDERGLTVSEVLAALQREHVEMPAGRIETEGREINVRVMGEALNLDAMRHIVVGQGNGTPIYLDDVALVEDGFEDVRRKARVNGVPAQGLGIKKQRGANAVAVAREVRAAMDELRPQLPKGMELGINFDSTQFIEESVHELEYELALAVLLTALVCWMFLGSLSSTLNVILAIPMSLLGTIAISYFLGFTLNTFTLLGLSLAVGIVVDDAIMVLENIFRHGEMGKHRVKAAREGTAEITFAALAATIAIVAIFLPVVFMKGVVGRFFLQFGITLSLSVLLSYVEAITLAPARCAQLLRTSREGRSAIGRGVDRVFDALDRAYSKVLGRAMRHPGLILVAALGVLAASAFLFGRLKSEFVPSQDQSRLMVRMVTAVGSDLEETDKLIHRAEAWLEKQPELEREYVVAGGFGGAGVNGGMMFLTMKPPKDRKVTQNEFAARVRKELNSYPGLRAIVMDLSQSGFTATRGFPLEFSVRGSDWDQIVESSNRMLGQLRESGIVTDLDSDYRLGMPELRIVPDRARAADLGISAATVATSIQSLVGGVRVGKFTTNGRRVDVRARLLAKQRMRPEDLADIKVRTASGALVPLSTVVTQDEQPALQAITRRDRERAITITGNIAPGHSQDEALALVESLSKDLPEGTHTVLAGASVAFKESMGGLIFALILGIIVAYMVLASQFNSLLHPVTVLTILPISVAGAAFALWATDKSLNIFSMIGLLLLLGIVKKNSIILVDYANQMKETGLSALDAMLKAGPVRLRPILMTSIATMMAAIPSALALGPGSETRGPMAIAIIGGLTVSTALSLLVVPAFYVVADRVAGKFRKSDGEAPEHGEPGVEETKATA